MATINQSGLSFRGGAALPTDLGQALSDQIRQFFARFRGDVASTEPSFGGPSFEQLSPGLVHESARR